MKRVTKWIVLFITIINILCFAITVSAMNTGMSTVELSEDQYNTFVENFDLQLLNKDYCKDSPGAICFDVSDKCELAVGFTIGDNEYICVHNENGDFQFGFRFDTSGSFAFEWDNDDLIIYYIRGSMAALVDRQGSLLEVKKTEDTADNSIYMMKSVKAYRKEIGGTSYIMKNNMIVSPYFTKIIAVDGEGTESIIFDRSAKVDPTGLLLIIGVILIPIIAVVGVTLRLLKSLKQGEIEYEKKHKAANITKTGTIGTETDRNY